MSTILRAEHAVTPLAVLEVRTLNARGLSKILGARAGFIGVTTMTPDMTRQNPRRNISFCISKNLSYIRAVTFNYILHNTIMG
jgi:hypothetical protein